MCGGLRTTRKTIEFTHLKLVRLWALFLLPYLSLHENEDYLKDHMVEDPVAGARFPKFAAGATLEWQGRTLYFIGEETRREFEKQQGIGSK